MADSDRLTSQELADRAGVTPEYIDRLVDVGVLAPGEGSGFRPTDARRVRIIEALEAAGLPLAALGESFRRGDLALDFVDQPSYERFASHTATTFAGLSDQTGVPVGILLAIREAMGFARAAPDDSVRETELGVVPMLQLMVDAGVREPVIERAVRVYGDAVRRVAETEADWWGTDILGPLFGAGLTSREVGDRTARFATEFSVAADRAVLALYHGQQSNAWMRNILEGFERLLARTGVHARVDRPPAISFLDLTGYTRLTEERGDTAAAALAAELASLVQGTSQQHGGRAVKWLGDGVMFHFRNPGDGVRASLEMVEAARAAGLPPAHVGLHAGPVLFQEGDYFGRTVNVAARISDRAGPGEVLVSREAVDAIDDARGVAFSPVGAGELKGISGEIELFLARRAD